MHFLTHREAVFFLVALCCASWAIVTTVFWALGIRDANRVARAVVKCGGRCIEGYYPKERRR